MELKLISVTKALKLGLITKGTKVISGVECHSLSDKDGEFLFEEMKEGVEPFQNEKIEIINGEVTAIHL